MKASDYIASFFASHGVDTVFMVTGGGAMHLNDSFAKSPDFSVYYFHHEQAAAMAAEGYARVTGRPCVLNVTSGPGALNSLTGIFGAYTDSVPVFVVSGQVKTETLLRNCSQSQLRQLGDQEAQINEVAKTVTKWVGQPTSVNELPCLLKAMYCKAVQGRPGPSWLDVPVDIQAQPIVQPMVSALTDAGQELDIELMQCHENAAEEIIDKIREAKRPVIVAGTGVRISDTVKDLQCLAESLNLPVTTAWTHDIFDNDHELFAGRPGTIGTRAGNFVVQNADLVLVLGSRLNIRQISYNLGSFASKAKLIWVDIDPAELKKPFPLPDMRVAADLSVFMPILVAEALKAKPGNDTQAWLFWCQDVKQRFSPKAKDYPVSKDRINVYHFVDRLFSYLRDDDIVVCGNASATIVPFQIGRLKKDQRLISNSGCASMGYDLPAAIGCAIAAPSRRVICLAGDGSVMMNIQDLITIKNYNLNVSIFLFENDGYLSIKQTQKNFFGRENGSSSSSGLLFPSFQYLAKACDIAFHKLDPKDYENELQEILSQKGPQFTEVPLDLHQEFEPRLKSRAEGNRIVTPELDDMYPFLDRKLLDQVRSQAPGA